MARPLAILAVLLAGALGAAGLTFSAAQREPAAFRFINGSEPQTLDPARMTGQPEKRIVDALFEGLTRRDARTLRPVPGVAESWEVSDDGRTWTFRLRASARWSDGRPVTAGDFVHAWRRLLEPATGAEYAYILYPLEGARALHAFGGHARRLDEEARPALAALRAEHPEGLSAERWQAFLAAHDVHAAVQGTPDTALAGALTRREGRLAPARLARLERALGREARRRRALARDARRRFGVDLGVHAPDPRTLVVELKAPVPYFLELTSFFSAHPVRRDVVEARPRDWFLPEHLVCNGPFVIADWRVNDRIRLERNPHYWDRASVRLPSVDALSIDQPTTSLNLYLSGDVHWLPSYYPNDLVDVLRQRPDFYRGPGMIVYYYRINTRRPPLDDPRVRLAIGLAIDRRQITESVLGLGQVPAVTVVPPGMPGYASPESALGFDPERARALLAEAGHPGGRGVRELGILYNTQEVHKKIAEVVADQLRRHLGLRVSAYNQEWQSYLASTRAGDYDLARAGWIGDYLDPNTFLDLWVTDGGNNQTGWGDPAYDALVAAAADVPGALQAPGSLLAAAPDPARLRARVEAWRAAGPPARAVRRTELRMELLRQAESILVGRGVPVIPIYFYVVSGLVQPEVQGFYSELELPDGSRAPNLQDIHPLRALRVRAAGPGG